MHYKTIFLLIVSLFASACVGPASPFGAVNTLSKKDKSDIRLKLPKNLKVHFAPKKQVIHNSSDLKVTIFDPEGITKTASLKAYYNDVDVSDSFFKNSKVEKNDNIWSVKFDKLSLLSSKNHEILFEYKKSNEDSSYFFEWERPNCYLYNESWSISNTGSFKPSSKLLTAIEKSSKEYRINPSLTAGLIAQESGFNPKAISWAKAIGLTQVTPIADEEIKRYYENWPRAPEVKELPVSVLKPMISMEKITPKDDWRLDPKLSIKGGLSFLRHLTDYWYTDQNKQLLIENGLITNDDITSVILASYNSGGARVNYAIKKHGKNYLQHRTLGEARKYVNRIKSFCYHFSQEGEL